MNAAGAQDHDDARRAALAGQLGVLTDVQVRQFAADLADTDPAAVELPLARFLAHLAAVRGADIEGHADAAGDAAERLAGLLDAWAATHSREGIDVIAVFKALARAAEALGAAAAALRSADYPDFDPEAHPSEAEFADRWDAVLAGLASTGSLFTEIAEGWI